MSSRQCYSILEPKIDVQKTAHFLVIHVLFAKKSCAILCPYRFQLGDYSISLVCTSHTSCPIHMSCPMRTVSTVQRVSCHKLAGPGQGHLCHTDTFLVISVIGSKNACLYNSSYTWNPGRASYMHLFFFKQVDTTEKSLST